MSDDVGHPAGFHGKLLARGDFVTRRLTRRFLDVWDVWLQTAIGDSKQVMGDAWLEAYLNSPIWRFAISAGIVDETAMAGVLMPSVDRVGRYFPMTIVGALPDCRDLTALPITAAAWFEAAEAVARTGLEERLDFDRFDADVSNLGAPACNGGDTLALSTPQGLRLVLPAVDAVAEGYRGLVRHYLEATLPGHSLWWTAGSEDIPPAMLICRGLPAPNGFPAFLDRRWDAWGWGHEPAADLAAELEIA